MKIKDAVRQCLETVLNKKIHQLHFNSTGGGCINECYRAETEQHEKFFVKFNSATKFPSLFEKEKTGLSYLKQQGLKVPAVITTGESGNLQFIILEWIDTGSQLPGFWEKAGTELARIHHIRHHSHGFFEDNYIGSLIQVNTFNPDWCSFFINERILPQLQLAGKLEKKLMEAFDNLFKALPSIFGKPAPGLLHGDLWSGNYMCNSNNEPVFIDPAVYFGFSGMDLGMTRLFGGFDENFYDAYHHHSPLPKNLREQQDICNLYPLLIHLNLFGGSYLGQISSIMKKF